jgi:phosphate-selective porin OprO/OprP
MGIDRKGCGARLSGLAGGVAIAVALAAPGGARAEDEWSIKWSNGLKIESADKSVEVKIGGIVQLDMLLERFDQTAERDVPSVHDRTGVKFRRARIVTEGTVYEDIFFKAQYDFAGGTAFKDVYLGIQNLPYGSKVRVGHMKEPFSLEQLTSSAYITFLERSLADNLVPARNTGILANGNLFEDATSWQVGGFRETNDNGDDFDNNVAWNVTLRGTFVPWAEEKDTRLLHLGAAYSHKFTDRDEPLRFRARPGIGDGDRFVDTGNLPADSVDLFGVEGALVLGPFSLQSEYVHSLVDRPPYTPGDVGNWGTYAEASYFLTGENRSYKREMGTFDRVKPKENFNIRKGTWGAWQVAFRYDVVDLSEKDVQGGQLQDLTTALNWYLTPNARVMANYVHGHRSGDGNVDSGGLRFQIDY